MAEHIFVHTRYFVRRGAHGMCSNVFGSDFKRLFVLACVEQPKGLFEGVYGEKKKTQQNHSPEYRRTGHSLNARPRIRY